MLDPYERRTSVTADGSSSNGTSRGSDHAMQSSYLDLPNPSLPPSTSIHQRPASSSSLFSRSELQAIDGFLESFSAPLSNFAASSGNNQIAGYGVPWHAQPPPYSVSTAIYRPEYEAAGWRGGPPTIASSNAPTLYNNQRNKYDSYISNNTFLRASSPSSASASSSSYPKTLGQVDHPGLSLSTSLAGPASGLGAVHPSRISSSPFSTASHAEENPEEREKRLKTQAEDLAGWLTRYKHAEQPSLATQRSANATTSSQHRLSISSTHHAVLDSPHRGVQTSRPSSMGSTSNSESLPTPSSRGPTRTPYVDFVAGDVSSVSNMIEASDMSALKTHPVKVPTSLEQTQIAAEPRAAKSTSDNNPLQAAASRSKPKPAKPAGPAKKKASSTTAAVREKKKPLSKAPASKVAKSGMPSPALPAGCKVEASPTIPEQVGEPSNSIHDTVKTTSTAAKMALSEEQKRANHIASEQKRRHAIRAAYDTLCTVVPSLRAAIEEYEDRLSKLHPTAVKVAGGTRDDDDMEVDSTPTLHTVAGALTGGIEVGGEKIDGRAGPRSEAVVLAKTVEYMRDLLDQREESLARVQELQAHITKQGKKLDSPHALDDLAPWNAKWRSRNR